MSKKRTGRRKAAFRTMKAYLDFYSAKKADMGGSKNKYYQLGVLSARLAVERASKST